MKKIVISLFLLIAFASAKSQNTLQFSFCFNTVQPTYMDSVLLEATLNASTGYQNIVFSQVSGPNTAIFEAPVPSFKNNFWEKQDQWVKGLIPGIYVFEAVGTSQTGQTSSFTDSVSILTLPASPALTAITVTLFGIPISIPAGQGTKYTTSDGVSHTF